MPGTQEYLYQYLFSASYVFLELKTEKTAYCLHRYKYKDPTGTDIV